MVEQALSEPETLGSSFSVYKTSKKDEVPGLSEVGEKIVCTAHTSTGPEFSPLWSCAHPDPALGWSFVASPEPRRGIG